MELIEFKNEEKEEDISKIIDNLQFERGLFIFRRDYRTVDNIGLNLANSRCKTIYPVFIFTPEQVGSGNQYKSDNAVQFMIESLMDLNKQTGNKLSCYYGNNLSIISELVKALDIDYICFNLDYTPYAKNRDYSIFELSVRLGIFFEYGHDYYLHEPGTILNVGCQTYQKFTPYYNAASKKKVLEPTKARKMKFSKISKHIGKEISLENAMSKFVKDKNINLLVKGGRTEAIKALRVAKRNISHYSKTRDELSKPTSLLSAHIKFGTVSIREVYYLFKSNKEFIRQLYWRDFYADILNSYPHVLEKAMKPQYDKIKWHHNSIWFDRWCNAECGYPIVDACMRQLNTTAYIHNRGRLIVATFLVKVLGIDWTKGAKYFSNHLVDYDPSANQLNWQWCSSSAVDSPGYFRIMNPWLQAKAHDPDCVYIKQWIPELIDVPIKDILNWDTEWINYKHIKYPKPIVDYSEEKQNVLQIYKDALY
jgi:deoxyribodipyrimidine photo-lyase